MNTFDTRKCLWFLRGALGSHSTALALSSPLMTELCPRRAQSWSAPSFCPLQRHRPPGQSRWRWAHHDPERLCEAAPPQLRDVLHVAGARHTGASRQCNRRARKQQWKPETEELRRTSPQVGLLPKPARAPECLPPALISSTLSTGPHSETKNSVQVASAKSGCLHTIISASRL